MTEDEQPFPGEPPVAGDEADTMLGSLERQRRIFAWKCGGLDSAGLSATAAVSTMTLGGLVKHLALVEDEYFTRRLLGRELGPPWDAVDWDADPDWEWHSAAGDSPEQLMTLWREAAARSRSAVAQVLAEGGLDQRARYSPGGQPGVSDGGQPSVSPGGQSNLPDGGRPNLPDGGQPGLLEDGQPNLPDDGQLSVSPGGQPSLRRILIDLIEEYARHIGHADLIRESVDGLTGEEPPG